MPAGRPTKLTKKLTKAICGPIELIGLPLEDAAALVGIAPSTVYLWLEQGRAGKSELHVSFMEAIAHARATDRLRRLMRLDAIASSPLKGNPSIDTWFLSRTSKTFRDKQDIGLSDGDGGPIKTKNEVSVTIVAPDKPKPKNKGKK